jgi:hypothetical protein
MPLAFSGLSCERTYRAPDETERPLLKPLDASRLNDFVELTADPQTMRLLVGRREAFERDVVARDGPYRLYRLTREQWGSA